MGAKASFPIMSLPRERVTIVTGGNTGLGYEIAKWTAFMGASVIVACRSQSRAQQAIERMQEEYRQQKEQLSAEHEIPVHDSLSVEYMPLDLSSFKSVIKFAEDFRNSGRKLHVLVCNAGIAMSPFEKTEDGHEKMCQVNYLGHFLLISKLLPVMRTSGDDCRLLMMSSDAHKMGTFDLKTMNYEGDPHSFKRADYYGRSKLYQVMQMHSLVRRLQGTNVSVNTSHPGLVETELDRNFRDSFFWNKVVFGSARATGMARTPLYGATSLINAVVNPELQGVSGMYYVDCKNGSTTSDARNEDKQEALWKTTLNLLKEHITEEELRCLEGK